MKADIIYLIMIIVFTIFIIKENVNASYTKYSLPESRKEFGTGNIYQILKYNQKIQPDDLCESLPDIFSLEKFVAFPKIPQKKSPKLCFPLKCEKYEISSHYGVRIHPVLKRKHFHTGTDFAVNRGTEILSVCDGIVDYSGWKGKLGKTLVIKNNGEEYIYGHCSKLLVKKGDIVKQGQLIGKVGRSGRTTGCHLHFSIRKEGKYLNPEKRIVL